MLFPTILLRALQSSPDHGTAGKWTTLLSTHHPSSKSAAHVSNLASNSACLHALLNCSQLDNMKELL